MVIRRAKLFFIIFLLLSCAGVFPKKEIDLESCRSAINIIRVIQIDQNVLEKRYLSSESKEEKSIILYTYQSLMIYKDNIREWARKNCI